MLTVISATNPQYSTSDKKIVSLLVQFAEFSQAVPFGATADDVEEHGRILYQNAINGEYGVVADYTPPSVPAVEGVEQPTSEGAQTL